MMTKVAEEKIWKKLEKLEGEVQAIKTFVIDRSQKGQRRSNLTMREDPLLGKLWNNSRDARYDQLAKR